MSGEFGADTFAEDSAERMEPWASDDLTVFTDAIGLMFEQVQEIVVDGDQEGWTVPLTLSKAKALDWLGQFLGVRREPRLTDAQFRTAIDAVEGFNRGTPAAIRAATEKTLTGTKEVGFYERDGDPYNLTVVTYTSETPDQAATEAAIRAVKPAGIVLTYLCVPGYTYTQVNNNYADYTALEADVASYQALIDKT